jgi:arginine-tRNA-protein transferase
VDQPASFKPEPTACEYRPDQQSQLYYEVLPHMTPAEYSQRLKGGWRRFGPVVFRPECPACDLCQSLRVVASEFRPSRSQRRAWDRNEGELEMHIGPPAIDEDRLDLFTRFHAHGHQTKGWPEPEGDETRLRLAATNPFLTEEWTYWAAGRLIGVSYVDVLPAGLSAIYFVHAPEEHRRSLGIFNILKIIEAARRRGLPHVYLGYYVDGCRSLTYKAAFRPNEVLAGGRWNRFVA